MLKKTLTTACLAILAMATAEAQDEGIAFRKDIKAAVAEAKEKGLGMMIYFTSRG